MIIAILQVVILLSVFHQTVVEPLRSPVIDGEQIKQLMLKIRSERTFNKKLKIKKVLGKNFFKLAVFQSREPRLESFQKHWERDIS